MCTTQGQGQTGTPSAPFSPYIGKQDTHTHIYISPHSLTIATVVEKFLKFFVRRRRASTIRRTVQSRTEIQNRRRLFTIAERHIRRIQSRNLNILHKRTRNRRSRAIMTYTRMNQERRQETSPLPPPSTTSRHPRFKTEIDYMTSYFYDSQDNSFGDRKSSTDSIIINQTIHRTNQYNNNNNVRNSAMASQLILY